MITFYKKNIKIQIPSRFLTGNTEFVRNNLTNPVYAI